MKYIINKQIKQRLNDKSTVFIVKVSAIQEAIDYIINYLPNNKVKIISDLQSIISPNEERIFILNIRKKIDEYQNKTVLD